MKAVLRSLTNWAIATPNIHAVALVGSWARGTARLDSDIDIMLLVTDPAAFQANSAWLHDIDWPQHRSASSWKDETYGAVWSRHVRLKDATEVELSFGLPAWAAINPIDSGTRQVVCAGCRILYDPLKLLESLMSAVEAMR